MNQLTKRFLSKLLSLSVIFGSMLVLFSFVGGDSYEIYLNNKLILQKNMHQSLKLSELDLSSAKAGDKLRVKYFQCNRPDQTGRDRKISLKDNNGKTIREWTFNNVEGSDPEMVIEVKELIAVQKQVKGNLVLVYSAQGISKGHNLATISLPGKIVI